MADYFEVSSVREDRNGQKRWTRLGVAFPFKQGEGFSVSLAAIPAPENGEYKLVLTRPKPRDDQRGNGGTSRQQQPVGGGDRGGGAWGSDLDDDVPFVSMQGDW